MEWIGYLAAFLGSVAFLPQIFEVMRTRSVESLSLPTYLACMLSQILWIYYGFYFERIALIIANALALIQFSTLVFLKIRWSKK
jgi:MtN3 and saliva related transmembrane protein